jgi:hypothetical protein
MQELHDDSVPSCSNHHSIIFMPKFTSLLFQLPAIQHTLAKQLDCTASTHTLNKYLTSSQQATLTRRNVLVHHVGSSHGLNSKPPMKPKTITVDHPQTSSSRDRLVRVEKFLLLPKLRL